MRRLIIGLLVVLYGSQLTVLAEDNVPKVIIDTKGQEISYTIRDDEKIDKIKAEITIISDEGEEKIESYDILIGVRGNTTRRLPKKQYGFTVVNDEGEEKNESLLEMPKHSKWILNASMDDLSMMRNKLAYDISGKIMDYAPRSEYCEVYLVDDNATELNDSHYQGLYILLESIARDENRVDISKPFAVAETTSFITVLNDYKVGDFQLHNYGFETYMYDTSMIIEYPKRLMTDEKEKYVNDTISQFERVLFSDLFKDPIVGYRAHIEVETFVDYYIINEFFKNTDSGYHSTYLHKDYDSLIKAGPVWDFDTAFGNSLAVSVIYEPKGLHTAQTAWFSRLFEDEWFANQVVRRYESLRQTYLSDDYLQKQITIYENQIKEAMERNLAIWPIELINQSESIKNYYDDLKYLEDDTDAMLEYMRANVKLEQDYELRAQSFEEEIDILRNFITERGEWLDEYLSSVLKWSNEGDE